MILSLLQVMRIAHKAGAKVAMTAGDANVIRRHKTDLWDTMVAERGIDVFFANKYVFHMSWQMSHVLECTETKIIEASLNYQLVSFRCTIRAVLCYLCSV